VKLPWHAASFTGSATLAGWAHGTLYGVRPCLPFAPKIVDQIFYLRTRFHQLFRFLHSRTSTANTSVWTQTISFFFPTKVLPWTSTFRRTLQPLSYR